MHLIPKVLECRADEYFLRAKAGAAFGSFDGVNGSRRGPIGPARRREIRRARASAGRESRASALKDENACTDSDARRH